jgi:glycosyltransferase involved in cell wall biosynthesis
MISIIIPVYGVEKYLHRCIDSVINQTYSNLEIILVDDGSPDNCPIICDEYARKDKRIIVIHQKNAGLAGARNAGLAKSTGDYIGFIDSDDWIEADTFEYLMQILETTNSDAAQIDYKLAEYSDCTIVQPKEKIEVYSGKEILQYFMTNTTTTGSYSVCRCLFSRNVLNGILFRVGKINEDIDYKYKVLNNCSRFVISNQLKYFYFQSGNSISSGGLKRKDFDLYEAADELASLTSHEGYGTIRHLEK